MDKSNDRNLLEWAAKAAGVNLAGGVDEHGAYEENWNPLTDDGAALRLAVNLNLDIMQDPLSAKANAVEVNANEPENAETKPWAWEHRAPDPYAATRRAIVRAAAEIGKATP